MKYKNIYVAASNQHVGKTTSTLGLVSSFLKKRVNVGYCKPVGQRFLDLKNVIVDKDTLLFADLIQFEIEPELHSPIILPSKTVRDLIEKPHFEDFQKRILAAKEHLNRKHDLVIFEGTGHPGVGSVVGMSNARVARLLDAGLIMIVEGGIGSTIDMLELCLSFFRAQNVPIIGVIINKVLPDKMDMVDHYVGLWLKRNQIPLLGLLPYDQHLAYPLMSTVADAIKGTVEYNDDRLDNRVENTMAGSLVDLKELKSFQNLLLIVSGRTITRAIKKIKSFSKLLNENQCPLSGIIVTGDEELNESTIEYIKQNRLPVIRSQFDTYGAVLKISRIEVKINRHTPWKIERAIDLITTHVNLDRILEEVSPVSVD